VYDDFSRKILYTRKCTAHVYVRLSPTLVSLRTGEYGHVRKKGKAQFGPSAAAAAVV